MDSPDSNTRSPRVHKRVHRRASAGTSHLSDVGRSNVLQLVRLRERVGEGGKESEREGGRRV